mmetsp:Transcript_20612/g.58609  ORF Transcript_20612/g.58609 Transcript_20612/m.58609 type:complete len:202 (+) Transcript_20612:3067-3672(+)
MICAGHGRSRRVLVQRIEDVAATQLRGLIIAAPVSLLSVGIRTENPCRRAGSSRIDRIRIGRQRRVRGCRQGVLDGEGIRARRSASPGMGAGGGEQGPIVLRRRRGKRSSVPSLVRRNGLQHPKGRRQRGIIADAAVEVLLLLLLLVVICACACAGGQVGAADVHVLLIFLDDVRLLELLLALVLEPLSQLPRPQPLRRRG